MLNNRVAEASLAQDPAPASCRMIRVVLVAHEPLASALKVVAAHAFPECAEGVIAVDIPAADSQERAYQRVRDALSPEAETLILTDAFGATPCHAATAAAEGVRARVVAGVNVPMLWRVLCYRTESLDTLVARAIDGGARGLMQVSVARPQNQPTRTLAHDQVVHHHQ